MGKPPSFGLVEGGFLWCANCAYAHIFLLIKLCKLHSTPDKIGVCCYESGGSFEVQGL